MKHNPIYQKPDCDVFKIWTTAVIAASITGASSEGLEKSWEEEWNQTM